MHSVGQTMTKLQINLPTDIQTDKQTNKQNEWMNYPGIASAPNNSCSAVCRLPIPVARMRISLEKAFLHHEIAIQAHDGRINVPPPILAPWAVCSFVTQLCKNLLHRPTPSNFVLQFVGLSRDRSMVASQCITLRKALEHDVPGPPKESARKERNLLHENLMSCIGKRC